MIILNEGTHYARGGSINEKPLLAFSVAIWFASMGTEFCLVLSLQERNNRGAHYYTVIVEGVCTIQRYVLIKENVLNEAVRYSI